MRLEEGAGQLDVRREIFLIQRFGCKIWVTSESFNRSTNGYLVSILLRIMLKNMQTDKTNMARIKMCVVSGRIVFVASIMAFP